MLQFRFLLPAIHLALCPVMGLLSASTPGGSWRSLIPMDPICWPFLFSITSAVAIFGLFAILGTAQWFLVGYLLDAAIRRLYD